MGKENDGAYEGGKCQALWGSLSPKGEAWSCAYWECLRGWGREKYEAMPNLRHRAGPEPENQKDSETTVWERGSRGARRLDGGAHGGRASIRLMGCR